MPLATIDELTFRNSYPSKYGDRNGQLHAYFYRFSDGEIGEASHKSAPSWKEGDEVEYEITGETRDGENKLKVSKPGASRGAPPNRQPPARNDNRPPPARTNTARPPSQTSPLGVTVGMALNNAALDMRSLGEAGGISLEDDEGVKQFLWRRASLYLRLSSAFESGKIAPLPRGPSLESEPPQSEPETTREPEAPPPRRTAPRNEREAANQNDVADEDVPF